MTNTLYYGDNLPILREHIDSETWRVTLPGEYEFTYFYMIDGKPFLPPCRFTEKDDFGSENCIFVPDM